MPSTKEVPGHIAGMLPIMPCFAAVHLLFPSYPHRYENYEGSTLSCSGSTYYEFPILASGALFNGSTSPGPDRVVHRCVIPRLLPW